MNTSIVFDDTNNDLDLDQFQKWVAMGFTSDQNRLHYLIALASIVIDSGFHTD